MRTCWLSPVAQPGLVKGILQLNDGAAAFSDGLVSRPPPVSANWPTD